MQCRERHRLAASARSRRAHHIEATRFQQHPLNQTQRCASNHQEFSIPARASCSARLAKLMSWRDGQHAPAASTARRHLGRRQGSTSTRHRCRRRHARTAAPAAAYTVERLAAGSVSSARPVGRVRAGDRRESCLQHPSLRSRSGQCERVHRPVSASELRNARRESSARVACANRYCTSSPRAHS